MATSTIRLPEGFVLDEPLQDTSVNLPEGFVLDGPEDPMAAAKPWYSGWGAKDAGTSITEIPQNLKIGTVGLGASVLEAVKKRSMQLAGGGIFPDEMVRSQFEAVKPDQTKIAPRTAEDFVSQGPANMRGRFEMATPQEVNGLPLPGALTAEAVGTVSRLPDVGAKLIREKQQGMVKKLPTDAGPATKLARLVHQNTPSMAVAIASSLLTGDPVVGLAILGETEGGAAFQKQLDSGASIKKAAVVGDLSEAAEIGGEMLVFPKLLKGFKGAIPLQEAFKAILENAGQEGATGFVQQFLDTFSTETTKGKKTADAIQDAFVEGLKAIPENALVGGVTAGFVNAASQTYNKAADMLGKKPDEAETPLLGDLKTETPLLGDLNDQGRLEGQPKKPKLEPTPELARQIIQADATAARAFVAKETPSRTDMGKIGLPASSEAIRKALADEIRAQLQTPAVENTESTPPPNDGAVTPVAAPISETTASEPLQQGAVGEQAASTLTPDGKISSPSSTEAVPAESQPPQKLTPDGKIKTVEAEKPQRKPLSVERKGQDFDVALPNSDNRVSGKWAIVEADDIITSSGKEYDQTLQPRNRQSAASREQIAAMSSKLDPSQLQDSAVADTGAPIIDQYGQVISGNGRTEAIRVAYKQGNGKAYRDAIKAAAEAKGISTEGMKRPVLVRAMEGTGGLTVQQVAELANRSNILQRSEAELAEADAKAIIENDMMRLYAPDESGSVRAKTNQDFLNLFVEKTGAGNLRLSSGEYSPAIEKRVKSAVLAAILGNSDNARKVVTQAIEQSEELGIKRQIDGLMQVGGQLLKLARSKPEFDISSDISAAMDQLMQYKRAFQKGEITTPFDWTSQMTMFNEGMSKAQKILFTNFSAMKSAKDMADYVGRYIEIAKSVATGPSLFGEQVQPQAPIELLENIENERQKAEADSKRNLFDGGTKADSQRSEVKPEGKGTGESVAGTAEKPVEPKKLTPDGFANKPAKTRPTQKMIIQRGANDPVSVVFSDEESKEVFRGLAIERKKGALREGSFKNPGVLKVIQDRLGATTAQLMDWRDSVKAQANAMPKTGEDMEIRPQSVTEFLSQHKPPSQPKKLTPDGKSAKPSRSLSFGGKMMFVNDNMNALYEERPKYISIGMTKFPRVNGFGQEGVIVKLPSGMSAYDVEKQFGFNMGQEAGIDTFREEVSKYLTNLPKDPDVVDTRTGDMFAEKPKTTIFSEEKRNEILRKQAERAEAARKERGGNDKRSGQAQKFTKEELVEAAYLLGYEAERGIRTLAAFTKKAIELFGEGIRKHIPQLWADTRKALNIPDEPKPKLTPDGKIKKDESAKPAKVKSKSVLANELADHLKAEGRSMNLEYDEMSIKKQAEDTQKLIEDNIDEAVRIAYGGENNTGIRTSAIKAGLFFQAKAEGNWELAQKFADISFNHNVAAGQEVAVLKGLITENSPLKWHAVLKSNLIEAAAKKFGVGKEGSATKKVMERVKKEVAKATEKISLKQMKISDAQAFIESLKC